MAAPAKLVQAMALFYFLIRGLSLFPARYTLEKCSYRDILVTETRTGKFVRGKPQYNVLIRNNCMCAQSGIQLNCTGFRSVAKIKPSILRHTGNVCMLIKGGNLNKGDWAQFKYAADRKFGFNPIGSDPSC